MNRFSPVERTLTQLDHVRLNKLTSRSQAADPSRTPTLETMQALLDTSDLVASHDVAPDIVTMYSQVLLVDPDSQTRQTLTLCYPEDSDPAAGFISVLSPLGASLLGLRVGALARWQTPHGTAGIAEVAAILFQPEASGDYTT